MQVHLAPIDAEVARILEHAREGRIPLSMPWLGISSAAAKMAAIGHIDNFASAAALKAYFRWAPTVVQSGASTDSSTLSRAGERTMKEALYLVAIRGGRGTGATVSPLGGTHPVLSREEASSQADCRPNHCNDLCLPHGGR